VSDDWYSPYKINRYFCYVCVYTHMRARAHTHTHTHTHTHMCVCQIFYKKILGEWIF